MHLGNSHSVPSADADRIFVLTSEQDRAVANEISDGLAKAGFSMAKATTEATTAIILVSASALLDPDWREALARLDSQRLIPARVGDLAGVVDGAIPERLSILNWLDWNRDNPTALGRLIATLRFRPDRQRQGAQAAVEARVWQSQGRPTSALCDDLNRLDEFRYLAARTDRVVGISPVVREYVVDSLRRMSARRRRRRLLGAFGATVLVIVSLLVIELLREARTLGRQNRLTAISSGFGGPSEDTRRWRTMSAAAALLEESNPDAEVARGSLRQLLALPSGIPVPPRVDHQIMTGTFASTGDQLIVIEENRAQLLLELRVFDPADGRAISTLGLTGQVRAYRSMDLSPNGLRLLAWGDGGLVVVQLASGEVIEVTPDAIAHAGFVADDTVWAAAARSVATYDAGTGERQETAAVDGELLAAARWWECRRPALGRHRAEGCLPRGPDSRNHHTTGGQPRMCRPAGVHPGRSIVLLGLHDGYPSRRC